MHTIYNFSAGPAMLPAVVLEQAQNELLNWRGTKMSVMEMSHRGKEYMDIIQTAESALRTLLNIPENYRVLFLQGGASLQFSMVPLNLSEDKSCIVDYIETGVWSSKAIKEAQKFATVNIVASNLTQDVKKYRFIPAKETWQFDSRAKYVHYTTNETIGGVEFSEIPKVLEGIPLVADMSSDILSRPIDVSQFGIIYAGAQKNIGPAGLTIVIIREDLVEHAKGNVPTMLDYKIHAKNASMYNTPPTYGIYIAGLVFQWLLSLGGLTSIEAINDHKAKILYDYLDQSDFYFNDIERSVRSRMNVPFWLKNDALSASFLKEAELAGLLQLKGHRDAGGMRASIYNAMPVEGVQTLVQFMDDFSRKNR